MLDREARACGHCRKAFVPPRVSTLYCSVKCAQASVTPKERRLAEFLFTWRVERDLKSRIRSLPSRIWMRKHHPEAIIGRGPGPMRPKRCPICRRPWHEFLYKTRGGLWRCFVRYHYNTPFGRDLIKAKLTGTHTWAFTCNRCNQFEKTIRRRSPKRWPLGISPARLRQILLERGAP
jgi:hypothetical protein